MAETYLVGGDGLYASGNLISPGSQISGVAGAYAVSLGAPTGLALPQNWGPASALSPCSNAGTVSSNGQVTMALCRMIAANQAAYNTLRLTLADRQILVEDGQGIVRQP